MGFQVVVMLIDSFTEDVAYVRDVEVCMSSMICYIPGCIYYGSENFGLGLCMMTVLDLLVQSHSKKTQIRYLTSL
jgi:hypothetical protein